MVKLNWKIAFTKEKQIKKMRVKLLKNKTKKKRTLIERWDGNKKKIQQKGQGKKLKF
jgi:hypothetical protein